MATPGREPESVEQDATTLRDDTEITLLDHDVAVVHADGIEIVVDDRTRPVEVVAADEPPAPWRRALRPLIVAAAVVITLLVVALGAAALRDDGDDVATDSSPTTARTTPSSAPQTSVPTSAVPTTDAPGVVPPPVSTPDTQPPVTQPPATQPSTPPTTHSPTDYTGLTRTLSTTQISAPPGGAPAFTLTFVNTSSWTMRVPMPPCAYVTGGSQVCTAGGVLEELAPGGSITRNLSVTAPSTPGTYQVRVTNVANGDLTLTLTVS